MTRFEFTIKGWYDSPASDPEDAAATDRLLFSLAPDQALVAAESLLVTVEPVVVQPTYCDSCLRPCRQWVCEDCEAELLSDWVADLRSLGVKAAHPDDHWVYDDDAVFLADSHFDDGLRVGDLLALGSPLQPTRFVRVTAEQQDWFDGQSRWMFEGTGNHGC